MTRSLESQYIGLLRWYPKVWRQHRGLSLVGTLLDLADLDERDHLARGERTSMFVHGLTTRLDMIVASRARDMVSSILIGAGFGYSIIAFVFSSWAPWALPNLVFTHQRYSTLGRFYDPGVILAVVWTIVFFAALLGARGVLKVLLLLTALAGLALPFVAAAPQPALLDVDPASRVFYVVAAVAALFGSPRSPRWIALPGAGSVVAAGALYLHDPSVSSGAWNSSAILWEISTTLCWVVVGAILAAAVLARLGLWNVTSAIVVITVPWVAALFAAQFTRTTEHPGGIVFVLLVLTLFALAGLFIRTHRQGVARLSDVSAPTMRGIK